MDTVIVYLMADTHIQNDRDQLRVGDICEIYCQNKEVQAWIETLPVKGLQEDESGRVILSMLELIECVLHAAGQHAPDLHLQCENLGAGQVIIERKIPAAERWWLTEIKVGFASLIIFAGSAFTIMTYDQDVDVTGVFARIYQMVLGQVPEQPGVLEAAYAIGVAAGILLFFNPFTASKKRKEPSPIEIEMEKYESDIQDTIVKMSGRGKSGR